MTEILARGYSSETTQRELSNEYKMAGFRWFSKIFSSIIGLKSCVYDDSS